MKKTEAEIAREKLKYEIAEELGLMGKVNDTGWKSLTARESGRVGGILAKREKEIRKEKETLTAEAAEKGADAGIES